MQRIIGKYKGSESGPLLIITAAMHGNEHAGVKALDLLFKMLEVEPIRNPDFTYKGEIIGLIGNVKAYGLKKRYISKDINRCWEPEFVQQLLKQDKTKLEDEDFEIRDILDIVYEEIGRVFPDKIYLLDLHTTSSDGGIFCIATLEPDSIEIANQIHAPVITGLLQGLTGTTLHYFNRTNKGIDTTAIAFEGGQHDDPLAVNRCIAATINFMRAVEVIYPHHVDNQHDQILQNYAKHHPKLVKVTYRFHVDDNEQWEMNPGYKNFQAVVKGEELAQYKGNKIYAPYDGLILMPLYQNQGNDGFFIAEIIEIP